MSTESFWKGRRVIVTGGAGFLGSFLVDRLQRLGAHTTVPRSTETDLVDRGAVRALLARVAPEMVIHLAARGGGIGANLDNPGRFLFELTPSLDTTRLPHGRYRLTVAASDTAGNMRLKSVLVALGTRGLTGVGGATPDRRCTPARG